MDNKIINNLSIDFNISKIKGSENWILSEEVQGGWSGDKKYHILDNKDNQFLLRVSVTSRIKQRKKQWKLMCKATALNENISKVIDFGKIDKENIYLLTTWIKGESAKENIAKYSKEEQYDMGFSAGEIVSKLHSIPYRAKTGESWNKMHYDTISNDIEFIRSSKITDDRFARVIDHVEQYKHLLINRPLVIGHGDCHLGNMVIDNGIIGIVDLDSCRAIDPYYEFFSWWFGVIDSEHFQTGLVNGYFNNNIPDDYFKILSVYSSLRLTEYVLRLDEYGVEDLSYEWNCFSMMMDAWEDFSIDVPKWYKGIN